MWMARPNGSVQRPRTASLLDRGEWLHNSGVEAHIVPTSIPSNQPFVPAPFLCLSSPFHWSWMAGGAARQPLWTASALSARPWQHVFAPPIQLGGHSEQATCRLPTRGPPPRRDARASILLDFDTARILCACTIFCCARPIFLQHGTTMWILDPSLGERLSQF